MIFLICNSELGQYKIMRISASLSSSKLLQSRSLGASALHYQLASPQINLCTNLESDFFNISRHRAASSIPFLRDQLTDKNPSFNLQKSFLDGDLILNGIQLNRGVSADWESRSIREEQQGDHSEVDPSSKLAFDKTSVLPDHSPSIREAVYSQAVPGKTRKGSYQNNPSKNITKNMSKLLLKWIWVNRSSLKMSLQYLCEEAVWDEFILRVQKWKRFNNLTREFLRREWHCSHGKLFRVVSCHFFREHCRSSIINSNITKKQMHLDKIGKFLEGVANPEALQSLT